ncbi:MAG TPA: hypothetical protein VFX01_01505 [Methylophilaceae bacterium]|nr:hypothetical protein [Methylophilaceae bacterium]
MQKHYRILPAAIGLAAMLALPGCVTINIYFPEAAAQKAADKIIDDVWQLDQSGKSGKPAGKDNSAPVPATAPQSEEE